MAMNLSKIDEGIVIMSDINIPLTIEYLKKRFDVHISEDEIDFYVKHHKPIEIQIQLVRSYFAKFFGSYRDLHLCSRRDYITLMLILKKKLMSDAGYDDNHDVIEDNIQTEYTGNKPYEYKINPDFERPVDVYKINDEETENEDTLNFDMTELSDIDMRPVALPYIISGNLSDHINTRVIRNIKFTEKVENSYTFQKLQEENHKYLNHIKPNYNMQVISSLINTRFTYVEYEHPELLGHEITYSDDKIADEILFFLNNI